MKTAPGKTRRKDSYLTIGGLLVMVVLFTFLFYLPSKKECDQLELEIQSARKTIDQFPAKLATMQSLNVTLNDRQENLNKYLKIFPHETSFHAVLSEVARLAEESSISISRLEPLLVEGNQTYQTVPFRLSYSGDFAGIFQFLNGLEESQRLFHVTDLVLGHSVINQGTLRGELSFSLYAYRNENARSVENHASSTLPATDGKIR